MAGPAGQGAPQQQMMTQQQRPQPPTPTILCQAPLTTAPDLGGAPAAPVAPRRTLTEAQLQRIREKRGEALRKRNAKAQLQPQSAPMRSPTTPTAAQQRIMQQNKEEALSRRQARPTEP